MNKDLLEYLDLKSRASFLSFGRPCVIVMANNREHQAAITGIGETFMTGFIAHYLRLCLYEAAPNAATLSVLIARDDVIKRECYDANRQVFLDQECFVKTPSRFIVNIPEISAIDLIDCPYFTTDPRQGDSLTPDILLSTIPELKEYYVEGKGFVSNPAAQAASTIVLPHDPFQITRNT